MSDAKPKIAFFDFTGCEGCQLTVVDSLQTHPELLDAVEIVQFREAMSEKGTDYQIAFVEGSCTRAGDEARLQAIREQAQLVVALGACAHIGGVNAVRNLQALDDVRQYVYGEDGKFFDSYQARPIEAVIPVDAVVPGCPIDREEFMRVVKALLQGRQPRIPDYPMCVECKLKENVCVFQRGKICLGPITRAGCGALCPSFGDGCEGCRGLVSNPNMAYFKSVLAEHGLSESDVADKLSLFLTYQVAESEGSGDGSC